MAKTATAPNGLAAYDEIYAALRRIEQAASIALDAAGDIASLSMASARPESERLEFLAETIIQDVKRAKAAIELIPIERSA